MGLSSHIVAQQDATVSDDQGPWRMYILDHLDYIVVRSRVYDIDAKLMNVYRYDLRRFLKDHLNRYMDIGWIVQLINNFPNDFEFYKPGRIVIPDDTVIENMYHAFIAIQANVRT